MAMDIRVDRNVNANECYPCTKRAIQEHFSDTSVSVRFGLTRSYKRPSAVKRRLPPIEGEVLASLSVQRRDGAVAFELLALYAVHRDIYDSALRDEFENSRLAELRKWYDENVCAPNLCDGTCARLILLRDGKLSTMEIHY